jgi:hypothetical protein
MFSQLVSANPKVVSPLLIPQGQLRIYLGAAHRFIWPVHLAGWLELGWTTEPGVTPGGTPRATSGANGPGATPVATRTASKTRRSNKEKNPTEPNPTNESPIGAYPAGANPIDESPIGVGSAKAIEPIPVLVTDFLVDPSVPTND